MSLWLKALSFFIHSVRNDFTGFAIAAFIAWKLTVINAISIVIIPAAKNIHPLIFMRNAKSCSHLFAAHHATGDAIRIAMATSFINSFESNNETCHRSAQHFSYADLFGSLLCRINT